MNVLHVFKTYLPDSYGGVERVINQIIRGTMDYGVTGSVLTLSGNDYEPQIIVDGHSVYRSRLDINLASTGISFGVLFRFLNLIENVDIVHYHYPWPMMDILHFAGRVKKPTVLTYHSDIIRQKKLVKLYRPLREAFLSSVGKIVATSPNYLETSDVLQRHKTKTEIIPIGIDELSYPVPDRFITNHWASLLGAKFYLFVGVLRYYKGLHILLEAARETNCKIVIVGAGPIEEELRRKAKVYDLSNVHFLGFVPDEDKVALLKLCYAVVFPSNLRSEAFGVALLEGAMFGKPLISSEIGTGSSYINIHNETGLVIPPNDAQALRSAMIRLWDNEGLAFKMGKNAKKRYLELFTADKMAMKYSNIYKNLV